MPDWLVVARREFVERVRTIWFVIVTVLGPIGLVGIIVVPAWLSAEANKQETTIAVVDHTGVLGETLAEVLPAVHTEVELVPTDTPEDELLRRIRDKEIDGYLVLPEDTLHGGTAVYSGANATSIHFQLTLQQVVTQAAQTVRASRAGIPDDELSAILMPVGFEARHTTGEAEAKSSSGVFIVGYAVMFILYMAILLYAVNVLRSVVQEKTSRVVEIMVSSVKPRSLMLGKILGVGAVGIFQLAIWLGVAFVLLNYRETVLGWFGISGGDIELAGLSPLDIAVVLVYFLAGYVFYSAVYAAIGAMVNSEQEAQQVQTPVVLLLVIPVLCVQLVADDPRGSAAEILTMIPFSSPVLMPMRYLLDGASLGEVAVSLALLLACIAGAVWLAARIYRVGILMYGKRPSLRELARWIRHD